MKNLFFILCLFIFEKMKAQTTQEEYNYITKGYAIQQASGLDMKKGYSLEKLGFTATKFDNHYRAVKLLALMKESEIKPRAYMAIYQLEGGKEVYICIPIVKEDKSLLNQMIIDINETFKSNNNDDAYLTIMGSLTELISIINK